jgi:hypothetical protein
MATSSNVAPQILNYGASINIISGIQGISSGGNSTINMPVANRIHRLNFQCSGIAYGLGGGPVTAVPAVAGTETFSPVISGGVLVGVSIVNSATAKGNGTYDITITDADYIALNGQTVKIGQGATATYVVAGGVVTSTAVTNPGTVSFIPPELFFTQQKHLVNGVVMRDIDASYTIRLQMANNIVPANGEMDVFFTEPWRKIVDHDQATAWDLVGQSTYQILFKIASGISSPDLQGLYEFDYLRNARRGADGKPVLFLRPIVQHVFSYNAPSGVFNVTSLPIDRPIQRIWLSETGKGSITHIELYQDGNKVIEGTYKQVDQMVTNYGFNSEIFDYNVIFDQDQRLGKALKVSNNLILRVYSNAPTTLNVFMEQQASDYTG